MQKIKKKQYGRLQHFCSNKKRNFSLEKWTVESALNSMFVNPVNFEEKRKKIRRSQNIVI